MARNTPEEGNELQSVSETERNKRKSESLFPERAQKKRHFSRGASSFMKKRVL